MRWQRRTSPTRWRSWLAWYPVLIESGNLLQQGGTVAWLEWVERREVFNAVAYADGWETEYRLMEAVTK